MPTDVAPVTLTAGGNDIQDLDGIFLELVRGGPGELADLRGGNYVAPRLAGRVRGNRLGDIRPITLRGFVTGTGANEDAARGDYWDNRVTLASYFPVNTETALVAGLASGDSYTITVLPVGSRAITYNQVVPSMALVVVELESLDPDWELVGS